MPHGVCSEIRYRTRPLIRQSLRGVNNFFRKKVTYVKSKACEHKWNADPLGGGEDETAAFVGSPEFENEAENAVSDEEEGGGLSGEFGVFADAEPEKCGQQQRAKEFVELCGMHGEGLPDSGDSVLFEELIII